MIAESAEPYKREPYTGVKNQVEASIKVWWPKYYDIRLIFIYLVYKPEFSSALCGVLYVSKKLFFTYQDQ